MVYLAIVNEGQTLSNISLDDKQITTVVDIDLKIFRKTRLILASPRPIIYRIKGDSVMLESVVLAGQKAIGVTGVDKSKVEVAKGRICKPDYRKVNLLRYNRWPDPLAAAGNRRADFAIGGNLVHTIEFARDGGRIKQLPGPILTDSKAVVLRNNMLRRHAGGAALIDRNSLLATAPETSAGLMPLELGLQQLISEKKLAIYDAPFNRYTGQISHVTFSILDKVSIPLGVCRESNYRFVLPRNVPFPHAPEFCHNRITRF